MVIEKTGAVADPRDRDFATSRFDAPPRVPRVPRDVPSAASVAEFIRGTTLLYPVLGSPSPR